MNIPKMPWYAKLESGLAPIKPYSQILLIAIALVTLAIAIWGDTIMQMAWFVYLISP